MYADRNIASYWLFLSLLHLKASKVLIPLYNKVGMNNVRKDFRKLTSTESNNQAVCITTFIFYILTF